MGTYNFNFPNSNIDKNINNEVCQLERRPGEQGPHPLLSKQDRVRKLATGKDTRIEEMTQRSIQMRNILWIGTWNVKSMQSSSLPKYGLSQVEAYSIQLGKVRILGNELERNRVDICGLSEVRRKGHFTTTEGHTIIYSGGDVQ